MTYYKIQFHYSNNAYDFASAIPLRVGGTYKLTNDLGKTYSCRAKVLSTIAAPTYKGELREIINATEAEAF